MGLQSQRVIEIPSVAATEQQGVVEVRCAVVAEATSMSNDGVKSQTLATSSSLEASLIRKIGTEN